MVWGNVTFGAFVALAIQFGLLALALYPAMRQQFLLWLALRALMIALAAATLSPVVSGGIPQFSGSLWSIGMIANGIGLGAIGPFLASYLERDLPLPRLRMILRQSLWLGLGASLTVVLLPASPTGAVIRSVVLLLLIGVIVYGLVRAIMAGSQAARFQAIAWGPGIAVSLVGLGYRLAAGHALAYRLEAMFLALAIEFFVTAMGIGHGFMAIRRERDAAVAEMHAANRANATDHLTGIANRRGLQRHFDEAERGTPSGLAVIDCDHFKGINDRFGHHVGDEVLIAVAHGLKGHDVFAARLGGEEFVVLLYAQDWQSSAEAARRRISQAVRDRVPAMPLSVTASAGLASITPGESLATAMKRADRALYAAKEAGRNRSLALIEFRPPARMARIA
ncbi:MAG: GGDEF domain-containing protein [Nitrobacter sp.]|uniref:GGDEF domain-containing protein n=1 Tax=Nitrobacter sp. TaxID=29420 RepID=UPI0026257666|nr:GGDEF domain-containing protein [Nitrobacter sp.]MCV0386116.1 GGDEF domain-containing protein [Nitrobacter sp.]